MDTPITRAEHEEFRRNMEAEHKRINKRLDGIEKISQRITDLYISVNQLAQSIENMVKIQQDHTERLEFIENQDGEKWRFITKLVTTSAISTLVGAILSYIFFALFGR